MARKEFLDYVWKYCIEPQLGYSFSINHTLPYSLVAIQEANLATRWNPLYWQCACLCVNAGNYADDISKEEENEEEIIENEEEQKIEKRSAPSYGKIAKAIAEAQFSGVKIGLPDINEAQVDFVPDTKSNSILYSLQAINVVSDDLLNQILTQRPFTSLEDFRTKVRVTPVQMLGLIKAGCFDKLEGVSRKTILYNYLNQFADEEHPIKEKITTANIKKALDLGLNLSDYSLAIRVYKFKKYIDEAQNDKANKRYVLTEDVCLTFFKTYLAHKMNLSKGDYSIVGGSITIKHSVFKKYYDAELEPLMSYLNSEEGRKTYQATIQKDFIDQYFTKYCSGTESTWEFDTMCFYNSGHELRGIKESLYSIRNFFDLPEQPSATPVKCTIAGTVINAENNKHIVSLLTCYGVVDVKFYAGTYTQFNQKISVIDEKTKKKTVVDDTFFKRGNKLIVHGFRRENTFCCKAEKTEGSYLSKYVGLIESIHSDGSLDIRYTRSKKSV